MASRSRNRFALRVRWIAFCIIAIASIFIVRLYFLQVVHGVEYREKAESEYVRQSTNQVDRGSIFFTARDGTLISAATISSGSTVALNPKALQNPDAVFAKLLQFLPDLDQSVFIQRSVATGTVYQEIARQVPSDVGAEISKLTIPGVEVLKETWRSYPGKTLAAQTLGFVGFGDDGRTLTGRYGLEYSYNDALSRTQGGLYVNFFADLFTNIRSQLFSADQEPGADLVTSIEPTAQQFLEEELQKYDETWHPKVEGGIIMDPSTGAVIAMSSWPTFDPNNYQNADPNTFSNPLVENVYELGSIMKPITMAAGIDSGAITASSTYDDMGCITVDKAKICNYDLKARGVIPMQQILSQSLNVGASYIATRMGPNTYGMYLKKFGIEEETGIDLPNEGTPLVSNLLNPRQVEYDTASFGQGIALSPIAMTRALATLANHGVVPSPHVGVYLDYGGGITKKIGWAPTRQAISAQTADTVTRMLVTVVDTALQNGKARIPAYSIAAKTGTAQIARPGKTGYYTNRYLHSFFGYFPAYDPKFIIFFFASEPKGAQYASETWTAPFMETVKFLINYYDIPPDRAPITPGG